MASPCIVAMGGRGLAREAGQPWLGGYVLSLVALRCGSRLPRICYLPTAVGDHPGAILDFYRSYAGEPCERAHLELFGCPIDDLRGFLLGQDVIWVSGGNTANLLAIWRVHGIDKILREAWERGIVLCGGSAGSLCWFEGGTTDSFGVTLRPIRDGLGFLPGSHCPHYDGEAQRRPLYQSLVREGALPDGIAIDDHAAVRYEGTRIAEAVAARATARAWSVRRTADGGVKEEEIVPRLLEAVAR